MSDRDTIVALATPPGCGGIGVVRLSGAKVPAIAKVVLGALPTPRLATLRNFLDKENNIVDHGIALFFNAPHSFTGEHVLELQGHGGPVVMDMLVNSLVALGARLARPGEFSERAFHNHKLDLSQAEAVADLIESGSEAAARSALRSLQGEFSSRVNSLVKDLTDLRIYVEGAIDFPEEEIDFLADQQVASMLKNVQNKIKQLRANCRQGCLLHDGMTVVLAGQPNVGKSSLLNALSQQASAIVSDLPGTTRDIVRERIQIDGLPVQILDTAGLRGHEVNGKHGEPEQSGADKIENEGIRRALQSMQQADRVLLVVDDAMSTTDDRISEALKLLPVGLGVTLVRNKIDLTATPPGMTEKQDYVEIALSAKTGVGISDLRQHMKTLMGFQTAEAGTFMARRRHLDAIDRAGQHLTTGISQLENRGAGELLAEELLLAQQALSEITGEFNADNLLGEIFSHFCIGK